MNSHQPSSGQRTLRVGYKASAEQFDPTALLEYAVHAESAGLDSVWISDHFQPWRHEGGHAPFSLVWLAAAAAGTSRVTLGTSVLTPSFRYHPAVIAHAFATLGSLYPGRVALGVGSGEALNEIAVGAIDEWPAFAVRFGRLREAIEVMRALWTGERTSYDGEYFTTRDAVIYDLPGEPIPVYVAAGGPKMATFAGAVGDGFICTSGKGRSLYADSLLPAVAQGRAQSASGDESFDRLLEVKISYDRDPARALENTRFWAPLSLTPEQKHGLSDPMEMERAADALPIETVARRWIVASSADQALEALQEYVDLGFTHLVVHGPGHDQRRFIDQFAEDVLPGLRTLAAHAS